MKKRILILLCLAFTAVCMLGACGSKGDKNKDTHAFDSVKSEQVTEEEWKAALDKLNSVKNVSGSFKIMYTYKDGQNEEDLMHLRYDGRARYVSCAGYLNGKLEVRFSDSYETSEYKFCRDEENKVWVRREKDSDPDFGNDDYLITALGLAGITDDLLYAAYGEFTYDKNRSAYAAPQKGHLRDIAIKFTDGKVVGIRCTADMDEGYGSYTAIYEFVFYDYGTTTVTIPTEWEERSEEWWEGRTEYL